MLTESRKSFLSDVVSKYKEVKGWASGLTDSDDKAFLSSQGLKGIDVVLICWVFVPLMWAIQTGFQGVPYFVSFFKRRLKRVSSKEKSIRRDNRDKKAAKGLKSAGKSVKLRCCKSCEEPQLRKMVDREMAIRRASAREGKSTSTKKNYLRRLKKRVQRDLRIELAASNAGKHFSPPSQILDDILDYNEVSVVKVGEPAIMARKKKRALRSSRRNQEVLDGKRKLPIAVFAQKIKIFRMMFPQWVHLQLKLHFCSDSVASSRSNLQSFLNAFGLDLAYKLAVEAGIKDKKWEHVADFLGKLLAKRSNQLNRSSGSSLNSSSYSSSSSTSGKHEDKTNRSRW